MTDWTWGIRGLIGATAVAAQIALLMAAATGLGLLCAAISAGLVGP